MKFSYFALTLFLVACNATEITPSRSFDNLSKTNQKLVQETYLDLLAAQEKKDYARVSANAKTILALLEDYKDTKAYAGIAQRGIDQAKLDKDPEHQKRKEFALRDLAELEIRGQGLLASAHSDPIARAELYKVMKKIESIDPANTFPNEWQKKLHE